VNPGHGTTVAIFVYYCPYSGRSNPRGVRRDTVIYLSHNSPRGFSVRPALLIPGSYLGLRARRYPPQILLVVFVFKLEVGAYLVRVGGSSNEYCLSAVLADHRGASRSHERRSRSIGRAREGFIPQRPVLYLGATPHESGGYKYIYIL